MSVVDERRGFGEKGGREMGNLDGVIVRHK